MSNRSTTFFFALMIATASLVAGMVIASRLDLSPVSFAQSAADTSVPPVASSEPVTGPLTATTFRDVAADVSPAVVNIRTESRAQSRDISGLFEGGGDLFERFFGGPEPEEPQGRIAVAAGTGFIIDRAGYILTNNHVVENAEKIEVFLFGDEDQEQGFEAEVVGRDPLTDSALIRLTELPGADLPIVRFGDSAVVQPGDWVMAIGNPFNLAHTVSVGVISALARPFPISEGRSTQVLQTDAAINPGNSGGPLINLRGEVIGINTAIYTDAMQSGNIGIGFAVPMNAVRELLPQLRAGRVSRGVIGVSIGPVPPDAVDEFGLSERMGALVRGVNRGGPAANAGIEPGDVIISFNGQRVDDEDALVQMVLTTRPGDTVPVEVMRDSSPRTLRLTVGELNLDAEQQAVQGGEAPAPEATTGFGLGLGSITPDAARQLQLDPGTEGALVVSVEPQSAAARAGVAPGDVILEVNRRPVATAAAASRELGTVPSGGTAFLLVLRGGQETFITITRE
jgi:serine protease Do